MKNHYNVHPRAIALLMAAVALPAIPAAAQDAAPPPVTATVPAPVAAPAPAAAAPAAPVFAPRQEVVQPVPVRPAPPAAAGEASASKPQFASTPRRVARPAPARAVAERAPVAIPRPAAPVAAAPAPVPLAAPSPVAPEATPPAQPAAQVTPEAAATETTTTTTSTPWLWIGLGILALATLGLLFARRRAHREEDVYYDEPVATAPAITTPIAAAPVAQPVVAPVRTKPVVTAPVKAATAPVADDERPWIGLSIWPKQVDDDGNVEYDLVVENASEVEAHDVRVSSFMIDGTTSSAMESSLIGDGDTRSVDVRAGASVQIAQTVTVTDGASPRIVAEARYPLPGGGEGHIAARFAIDAAKDGTVEARLDDLLERV